MWAPIFAMSTVREYLGIETSLLGPYAEVVSYVGFLVVPLVADWYYSAVDDGSISKHELALLNAYLSLGLFG